MPCGLDDVSCATSGGLGFSSADDQCLGADTRESVDVGSEVDFDDVALGERSVRERIRAE